MIHSLMRPKPLIWDDEGGNEAYNYVVFDILETLSIDVGPYEI